MVLHSFISYINTYLDTIGSFSKLPGENIEQTLRSIEDKAVYSIFLLPYVFDRLRHVDNRFPIIIFSYVTLLLVEGIDVFKIQIARSFPLLKR